MPRFRILALSLIIAGSSLADESCVLSISANPAHVHLEGPEARLTVLIQGLRADGTLIDLTHEADFTLNGPALVEFRPGGVVLAKNDGSTTLEVTAKGKSVTFRRLWLQRGRVPRISIRSEWF